MGTYQSDQKDGNEEKTSSAFKKAGERISARFKKIISFGEVENTEDEDEGGSTGGNEGKIANAFIKAGEQAHFRYKQLVELETDQKDTEVILDGNEALQKFLMDHEKEFGEVSKERRAHRKKDSPEGNILQQSGLPHHPLLDNTQRFDGISPDESPEATINPEAAEELDQILENDPKLVNNPQLRMALEHRKQMKMQLAQRASMTLNR